MDSSISPAPTVAELRAFFTAAVLPTAPVALCAGSTIVNARQFVSGHLSHLESKSASRKTKALFYRRLVAFTHILISYQ